MIIDLERADVGEKLILDGRRDIGIVSETGALLCGVFDAGGIVVEFFVEFAVMICPIGILTVVETSLDVFNR